MFSYCFFFDDIQIVISHKMMRCFFIIIMIHFSNKMTRQYKKITKVTKIIHG